MIKEVFSIMVAVNKNVNQEHSKHDSRCLELLVEKQQQHDRRQVVAAAVTVYFLFDLFTFIMEWSV